jgi:hypothetical protein
MFAHEVALFRNQTRMFGFKLVDRIIGHLTYRRVADQAPPFPPVIVPRIMVPFTRPV